MMNDSIRSKHVEQTKNSGIKIDYKNCASRWSLTHSNMMHGTHNVKKNPRYIETRRTYDKLCVKKYNFNIMAFVGCIV